MWSEHRGVAHPGERLLTGADNRRDERLARISARENAYANYRVADVDQKHGMHRLLFKRIELRRDEDGNVLVVPLSSPAGRSGYEVLSR